MFLLNLIDADFLHKIQKFTIQNVPIKCTIKLEKYRGGCNLHYKMFLLNSKGQHWSLTSTALFTIQNVPIKLKSYLKI